MPVTGVIGSIQSQPGQVQPGYTYTSTAIWRGPFAMHLAGAAFDPNVGHVYPVGTIFTGLSGPVASQLAASDPLWWEFH